MEKQISMPGFLARPMRNLQHGDVNLDASFFDRVERELIRPAVEEAGLHFEFDFDLHVGAPSSSSRMLQDILGRLEAAHLAVFDVSGLNPNVLIEYGYRRTQWHTHLVLLACRDVTPELPFDLKHHNVLYYTRKEINSGASHLINELYDRIVDSLERSRREQPLVRTDHVYLAYENLTEEDELLIWIATWPSFVDTAKERILENCRARRIVVAGPLITFAQLPGIFWRLDIRERRSKKALGPFYIYGKNLPDLKIILAGTRSFLAAEVGGRTECYYQLGYTSEKLKALAQDGLVGARAIEEEVYRFLLLRLEQSGNGTFNAMTILRAFDNDVRSELGPPEALAYR